MISLQAYRAAIGSFYFVAGRHMSSCRKTGNSHHFTGNYTVRLQIMKLIRPNLILVFFILVLLLSGDIEVNPGPPISAVRGSYHQADSRFGQSAGTQCMCNALFSLFFSVTRKVYYWTAWDLDYILNAGDALYNSVGLIGQALDVDRLPETVSFENFRIPVCKTHLQDGLITKNESENFLQVSEYFNSNPSRSGLIFIIDGFTFAIIYSDRGVYVFDSHSRDENGFASPTGASVLLKFRTLADIEEYIRHVYLENNNNPQSYFQIQYFDIEIPRESSIDIQRSVTKSRKRSHDCLRQQKTRASMSKSVEANVREKDRNDRTKKRKLKQNENRNVDFVVSPKKHSQTSSATQTRNVAANTKGIQAIKNFKKAIKEGPIYICVICNRTMYRRTVQYFDVKKYQIDKAVLRFRVKSFDGQEYVCITCNSKLIKGIIPAQAVSNDLQIFEFPDSLSGLRKLEKVLIAKRLLFKKVTIMPKGQSPKIRGAICNVPINSEEICNVLPRGMDNNGIVQVRLKKRLNFKSHVYFEAVRPEYLQNVLTFLKQENPLYSDINIVMTNIPNELTNRNAHNDIRLTFVSDNNPRVINDYGEINITFVDDENVLQIKNADKGNICLEFQRNESSQGNEEGENPLDNYRLTSSETAYVPDLAYVINDTTLAIAPGENKAPIPIILDKDCEVLAHPHLFPKGKFGYTWKRNKPLSPTKYFNQRLLNYTQKFASDSDYIFFAQSVLQHLNLNNSINIAMQKVKMDGMTAGALSQNYKERIQGFLANDDAFNFMNTVKGTPAYWKRFQLEVLAMIKQLGLPTFFMTLSCADLRWDELLEIISRLNENNILTKEEIDNMNYFDRTRILNSNPVLLARHFQYRVEVFFKEIIVDGPLGKVKHYAIRVEFQVRGSPHIHSLIWVIGAPILSENNKEEYITFVDSIVKCNLPDKMDKPELYNLVRTYQTHSHSKSCRKYKNMNCRYSFGRFFTDKTIIADPLPQDLPEKEKMALLEKRKIILDKVKRYIDTMLNPKFVNLYFQDEENYFGQKSVEEILGELQITTEEYYAALSISTERSFQIHFRRPPNSCFINNYFEEGLMAWEANLDIQPVLDYFKAVSYMCAYISKSEDESSEAMKQAAREAYESGTTQTERMKSIARAYRTHREMSVQEAVAILLPEIWLRKTSPGVTFANNNIPEKRYRICRSEEEISKMPEDSTDLFKKNMLDRYLDRPDAQFCNGRYTRLNNMCYAEFLANYSLESNPLKNENDSQPVILDELLKMNPDISLLPKNVPLMSSKEKLKLRKEKSVIRYHVPNQHTQSELYAHHLLFLFFPFRKESELNNSPTRTYTEKLSLPGVLEIVNENKRLCEPYADEVDEAFIQFSNNPRGLDPEAEQENDDIEEEVMQNIANNENENDNNIAGGSSELRIQHSISDEALSEMIRSLNTKQREIFEVVNKWARDHLKSLNSKNVSKPDPMHLFLTGSAGTGKSHLLNTMRHFLNKSLSYRGGEANKQRVLMLAPTGVAAVNIDGVTIHSALSISPDRSFGKCLPKLSDKVRCQLQNQYSELSVIIIDEISMVSNKLLLNIHQRLVEIFRCSPDKPFAGISVIVCGDFYQLPPIQQRPVYAEFTDSMLNICHCWRLFKIAELTEVMRQRGDQVLIKLLNNIRLGMVEKHDEDLLRSKFIDKSHPNYPHDAMHIFAENQPVLDHNMNMLRLIEKPAFEINAIDKIPPNISNSALHNLYARSQMNTGGLAHKLTLKCDAKVMLTSNLDLSDKLCNGQIGIVKHMKQNANGEITTVYLKMEDNTVGITAMSTDPYARRNRWVPIKMIEKEIKINKNCSCSPCIKRLQFPLTLSWACTVHKVQGKTFSNIVVCFDLIKQKRFNAGQIYVALSRVTTLDGLTLVGIFDKTAVRVDSRATEEYNFMRENCKYNPVEEIGKLSNDSLIVTLLNIRSLGKHAADFSCDTILMESDVLGFTETQIADNNNVDRIFEPFQIVRNNQGINRNASIAFGYQEPVSLLDEYSLPNATLFQISKESFLPQNLNFLLLYRSKELDRNDFLYIIEHCHSRAGKIDVIFGDFNIDAFLGCNYVSEYLSQYKMVVNSATHISGSLIDHVYISKDLCQQTEITSMIKNVYFTDHEAIKIVLRAKKN